MSTLIAANLARIQEEMATAALAAGREPTAVTLIAVGKTQSATAIQQAYAAGLRHFGENRLQEAAAKAAALRSVCPGIHWQLIGPLQTNKAARAVELCHSIATLDRPKLAQLLAEQMRQQQRRPDLLIEVNIGHEPQKAGIVPEALPEFLAQCRALALPVKGLMCIPPHGDDPVPHFTALARLADLHRLPERSMGMSGDFAAAIRCGSTQIRVGTALFGARRIPETIPQ